MLRCSCGTQCYSKLRRCCGCCRNTLKLIMSLTNTSYLLSLWGYLLSWRILQTQPDTKMWNLRKFSKLGDIRRICYGAIRWGRRASNVCFFLRNILKFRNIEASFHETPDGLKLHRFAIGRECTPLHYLQCLTWHFVMKFCPQLATHTNTEPFAFN